mgnify:CR=1 FL=1
MTCMIVDDNPLARDIIRILVQQTQDLELTAEFGSAKEALNYLKNQAVDLILMDMPEMSGIEFLRKLKPRPLIIIISGHEKYAVYGYEFNVADYLVKPVLRDRFSTAIDKAKSLLDAKTQAWSIQNRDFIFVKDQSTLQKVNFSDVLWLEAQGDYVKLNTQQKSFMVHGTLKSIEERLPTQRFMKVHRSFIVAIDKVERIEENIIYIAKKSIPVSDTYWKNLKNVLNIL